MTDAEIYMLQQNEGYQISYPQYISIPYDTNTGIIQKSDYMAYADFNFLTTYRIDGHPLAYLVGVMPYFMEWNFRAFLSRNNHHKINVDWAPYNDMSKKQQTTMVLDEIATMLEDNLPVVFSYNSFDKNKRIVMYLKPEYAQNKNINEASNNSALSHYMTIIGLYKYLNEESLDYEYLLEVVSGGNKYYIRYDEYSDSLNYFSNILGIY